ncbi:MAG: hypothetical protein RMJ88_06970 [Thermogemmata sp.]|nr:hypothetical protein [Thermogemmata sp.]
MLLEGLFSAGGLRAGPKKITAMPFADCYDSKGLLGCKHDASFRVEVLWLEHLIGLYCGPEVIDLPRVNTKPPS